MSDRQYSLLFVDQNLHNISVLYLPLTILAKMVLLQHSKLLSAELVQIGWGFWSDALSGSNAFRDDSLKHSLAKAPCQYSVTFSFTSFLKLSLATEDEEGYTAGIGP